MFSIIEAQDEQSRKPWLREKHLSLRLGDTPISPTHYRPPERVRDAYRVMTRDRARWAQARIGAVVAMVDLDGRIRSIAPSPEDSGARSNNRCANSVGDEGMSTAALAELAMLISVMYATLPQAEKHLSREFQDAAELIAILAEELGVTERFWEAMEWGQSKAQAMVLGLMVQTNLID